MNIYPEKIRLVGQKKLVIKWNAENESELSSADLRRYCPCATCMAERDEQSEKYFALYTLDQQTILKIDVVGSYGISIIWKDGHSTGIYDFGLLYRLANREILGNATT